jgi:hypothetical protein
VEERVEVGKDERVERGGLSGESQGEHVQRDGTYREARNHVSVARRSERAAMASA